MRHHDLDLPIIVDVDHDRVLDQCAAIVPLVKQLHRAVRPGVHIEIDLIGVHDVRDPIALEVIDRRARDRRTGVLGRLLPQHRTIPIEHHISGLAGHADLGQAITVIVRNRRRAADFGRVDHAPQHPAAGRLQANPAGCDDHDLGAAVFVEVGHRRISVSVRDRPQVAAIRVIHGISDDHLLHAVALEVGRK